MTVGLHAESWAMVALLKLREVLDPASASPGEWTPAGEVRRDSGQGEPEEDVYRPRRFV